MIICLVIAHNCFLATMAELSSWDRDRIGGKTQNISYLTLWKKYFANLWSETTVFNFVPLQQSEEDLLILSRIFLNASNKILKVTEDTSYIGNNYLNNKKLWLW